MEENQARRFEQRLTPQFISRNTELVEAVKRTPLFKDFTTVGDIELRLKTIGDGHGLGRADIVKFLQRIEGSPYNAGNFVVGRRGQPSRFIWSGNIHVGPQPSPSVAYSAENATGNMGGASTPAPTQANPLTEQMDHEPLHNGELPLNNAGARPADRAPVATAFAEPPHSSFSHTPSGRRLLKYTFPLQSDVLVQLELPTDLTEREADRVAGFIKSLAI